MGTVVEYPLWRQHHQIHKERNIYQTRGKRFIIVGLVVLTINKQSNDIFARANYID